MPSYTYSAAETILVDLVHDLRQNLGNIETSAYCLGLLNPAPDSRAGNYLRTIQQQVASAESRLCEARAQLKRLRPQPPAGGVTALGDEILGEEILDLTNSATSAVT